MEPFYCGVDVGASATKLVLVDAGMAPCWPVRCRRRASTTAETARRCLEQRARRGGPGRRAGRAPWPPATAAATSTYATDTRTEIHCHGVGCYHELSVRHRRSSTSAGRTTRSSTWTGPAGGATSRMNRKCAAGTGAFIEEIALRLGLPRRASWTRWPSSADRGGAAGQLLHGVRQDRDPVAPAPGRAGGGHRAGSLRFGGRAYRGDGPARRRRWSLTGGVVAHNPAIVGLLAERLGREVLYARCTAIHRSAGRRADARRAAGGS